VLLAQHLRTFVSTHQTQDTRMIVRKHSGWWIKKGGIGRSLISGPYRWKWVAVLLWPTV
jgi:hypothetical protein